MNTKRPYPIRRCFRCGRKTKVHSTDPKKLEIDPTTGRSNVYCRVCWPKLDPPQREVYKLEGFVSTYGKLQPMRKKFHR
jgi:hypothetical protein